MTQYVVKLFLSTYTAHVVEAKDEAEAYDKAQAAFAEDTPTKLGLELLANAECWPDANTIEEVKE